LTICIQQNHRAVRSQRAGQGERLGVVEVDMMTCNKRRNLDDRSQSSRNPESNLYNEQTYRVYKGEEQLGHSLQAEDLPVSNCNCTIQDCGPSSLAGTPPPAS